ncbi:50S ribosomal protein L9 [Candidatus Parcubacteria bacterium]|uniref:Large ribosomal subunit protein bL9 n=1 Tax=Candidatus Kaiserbacteria bacterium CG10_big_fil_rev_8_21_14_0_10_47_16 TaxID=1974608 RepID=A0A2H0UD11_9BACT|nr:50S ribosomal protein L9 [Candidatus Parcubacteria bacterium]PIR84281.1 MAG: 50S ribosomal protein L9 [Candidatus Kaiserbacteria bacterium CG10_big_fil_rev_8_21_14_0_10_47_16]
MKVILLQDVARIGRRFEMKVVPDGHALNMLIPKRLAEPATPENMRRLKERMKKVDEVRAGAASTFEDTLKKLEGTTVTLPVSANEQGHLFKSVKATDIAAQVTKEVGPLDADHIALHSPLKEVGEHEIAISSGDLKGTFTLSITKE